MKRVSLRDGIRIKKTNTLNNLLNWIFNNSGGPLWATFRWAAPVRGNGVVLGYEVQCWAERMPPAAPRPSACADARLSPSHTQLVLRDLTPQTTYYFRVS